MGEISKDDSISGSGVFTCVIGIDKGSIYTGEYLLHSFHGSGVIKSPTGTVKTLNFNNGYATGYGVIRTPEAVYKGQFERDLPHGHGMLTRVDGYVYEGMWEKGSFHGYGESIDSAGNRYSGLFKNHMRDGHGVFTHANGDKYVGMWKAGRRNGVGTKIKASGSETHALWKNDSRQTLFGHYEKNLEGYSTIQGIVYIYGSDELFVPRSANLYITDNNISKRINYSVVDWSDGRFFIDRTAPGKYLLFIYDESYLSNFYVTRIEVKEKMHLSLGMFELESVFEKEDTELLSKVLGGDISIRRIRELVSKLHEL
ncbi:MAG: hypothetical protein H8E26_12665 [FCB group bacterium]|nr:hypothetical protein [FCB group bacterium]